MKNKEHKIALISLTVDTCDVRIQLPSCCTRQYLIFYDNS